MFLIEWVVERSVLLSILFGLSFLGAMWVWMNQRSSTSLLVAAILGVLALLPWGLGWLVETEMDRARAALASLVDAVEKSDVEGVIARIDDAYQDGQRNKLALESLVRSKLPSADIDSIELRGTEWSWVGENVQASFVANIRGRYQGQSSGQAYPSRFKITFTKTAGTWRVESIKRFDVIQSATEIPIDRIP